MNLFNKLLLTVAFLGSIASIFSAEKAKDPGTPSKLSKADYNHRRFASMLMLDDGFRLDPFLDLVAKRDLKGVAEYLELEGTAVNRIGHAVVKGWPNFGACGLSVAIANLDVPMVKLLLTRGANPKITFSNRSVEGVSLLHHTVTSHDLDVKSTEEKRNKEKAQCEIASMLLEAGVNIDHATDLVVELNGEADLEHAITVLQESGIAIKAATDVESARRAGSTDTLLVFSPETNMEIVTKILSAANISFKSITGGNTVLHEACKSAGYNKALVDFLIGQGASTTRINAEGRIPSHYRVKHRTFEQLVAQHGSPDEYFAAMKKGSQ